MQTVTTHMKTARSPAAGPALPGLGGAPCEFIALIDHAEYLGVIPQPADPNGAFAASDWNPQLTDSIPTPRWSTRWAAEAGVPAPVAVPAVIRERAWTSPIWYALAARR